MSLTQNPPAPSPAVSALLASARRIGARNPAAAWWQPGLNVVGDLLDAGLVHPDQVVEVAASRTQLHSPSCDLGTQQNAAPTRLSLAEIRARIVAGTGMCYCTANVEDLPTGGTDAGAAELAAHLAPVAITDGERDALAWLAKARSRRTEANPTSIGSLQVRSVGRTRHWMARTPVPDGVGRLRDVVAAVAADPVLEIEQVVGSDDYRDEVRGEYLQGAATWLETAGGRTGTPLATAVRKLAVDIDPGVNPGVVSLLLRDWSRRRFGDVPLAELRDRVDSLIGRLPGVEVWLVANQVDSRPTLGFATHVATAPALREKVLHRVPLALAFSASDVWVDPVCLHREDLGEDLVVEALELASETGCGLSQVRGLVEALAASRT